MSYKDKLYYLLKKTEKYTGTDNVYLAKSGFFVGLSHFSSLAKALVLSILFTRLLSKEVYGEYKFFLAILGTMGIFALPEMATALIQAVARGYEGVYKLAIKTVFKWAWLGSLALLVVSTFYFFQENLTLALIFLIVAPLFPFYSICRFYDSFFVGKKRFDLSAKYHLIFSFFFTFILSLIILLVPKLFWIVLTAIALEILLNGFLSLKSFKKIENKKIDQESIKYGKHLSLISILQIIAFHLDKIIVTSFLGFEALAIYAVALIIPEQIKALMANLQTLIFPKLAIIKINEFTKKKLLENFYKLLGIVILVILFYILIAPLALKILYPKYPESIFYSQIFMLSFISFPSILFTTFFQAQRKVKEIWQFNIFFSLLQIISLIILIPLFGLWGAILARIITRFLSLIFVSLVFHRS